MKTSKLINADDADFFCEQINSIRDERIYENPSDYIERIRYIPKGLSPKPGFFEFSFTPYFREIFDLLSPDSGVQEIVFMKPAQIGYNVSILENALLYYIGSNPKYVQFVTADNALAKEMVSERIDPMIDHAGLRNLIFAQAKRRKSNATGDTSLHKEFPGGAINFVGAKNPDAFRGRTREITLLDEIDTYADDKKEGSKIDLIKNRSNAFAQTRKILYGSTPLIMQSSQIYKLYLMGDQRNYYIPCPRCGEYIVLQWRIKKDNGILCGIIFETENNLPVYDSIEYRCQTCEKTFKDYEKASFLLGGQGQWRPTEKTKVPALRSYWLNALYSPPGVYSWERVVQDFSECWDFEKNRIKDTEKYRSFRNTKQGLPFEERGKSIKYEKAIVHRRSGFVRGMIPEKKIEEFTGGPALLLVAAVDVQDDRLIVDVKAFADKGATFTIDFFEIKGSTESVRNSCFVELDKFICEKQYITESGKKYRITITFIDSGWGKRTDVVYAFCQNYTAGVYAIKGEEYIPGGIIFRMMKKETLEKAGLGAALTINTTILKDRISNILNNLIWNTGEYQPAWYPNFPENLYDDYFKQFEAEMKVDVIDKITKKWKKSIWKIISEGSDNHALDLYVYCLAALEFLADYTCRNILEMPLLSWPDFWSYCKKGIYYTDK